MIACSEKAYELMMSVRERWQQKHPEDELECRVKCSALPSVSMTETVTELTGSWFADRDAILYFCASGIAVRSIAPFIRHKAKDPAILVIDETGKFCISLLSGHLGGANALAEEVSGLMADQGMIPVITTATDREGRFAVDEFARKNGLVLTDFQSAKEISAAILHGEKILFECGYPVEGEVPEELILERSKKENRQEKENCERDGSWGHEKPESDSTDRKTEMLSGRKRILISDRIHTDTEVTEKECCLQLLPKNIVVGIGCRKGTDRDAIWQAVTDHLQSLSLSEEALAGVASIDLKQEEEGILAFCREKQIPFMTYSAEQLQKQMGSFTHSEFVEKITGVDNVCERSVVAAGATLLSGKRAENGVTTAVGEYQRSIVF